MTTQMPTIYRKSQAKRTGAAAAEFALVLPVLLILTFGTLEVCSAIFLRETLAIASHEGARVAIRKRATEQDVEDTVMDFLATRGIDQAGMTPGQMVKCNRQPERTEELIPITVTVTAKMDGNGILPNAFYTWFTGATIRAKTVMYKEFVHPDYEAELAAAS